MARERENLPVEVRPYRVGLTLSGGGAKGFAHVGALKAMEELSAKPVEQKGGNWGFGRILYLVRAQELLSRYFMPTAIHPMKS